MKKDYKLKSNKVIILLQLDRGNNLQEPNIDLNMQHSMLGYLLPSSLTTSPLPVRLQVSPQQQSNHQSQPQCMQVESAEKQPLNQNILIKIKEIQEELKNQRQEQQVFNQKLLEEVKQLRQEQQSSNEKLLEEIKQGRREQQQILEAMKQQHQEQQLFNQQLLEEIKQLLQQHSSRSEK